MVRKDEAERTIAYADYRRLPPAERTVGGLWRSYCQRKREGDTSVPKYGTQRTIVFGWAKADDWDAKLAEEEREALEVEKTETLKLRRNQTHAMWAMVPQANKALLEVLLEGDSSQKRLAAFGLLDRLGLVPESRTAAARRRLDEDADDNADTPELVPMPADDASPEEWARYYQAQAEH